MMVRGSRYNVVRENLCKARKAAGQPRRKSFGFLSQQQEQEEEHRACVFDFWIISVEALVDLKAARKVVAVFVEMLGMLMIALEVASKSML